MATIWMYRCNECERDSEFPQELQEGTSMRCSHCGVGWLVFARTRETGRGRK